MPTGSVIAAQTASFAASTRRRRGVANNVERIVPEEYSLDIASTPHAPTSNWARIAPLRLLSTICSIVATGVWWRYPMPTPAPVAIIATAANASSHRVDRTLRTLSHSARTASRNPYRSVGRLAASGSVNAVIALLPFGSLLPARSVVPIRRRTSDQGTRLRALHSGTRDPRPSCRRALDPDRSPQDGRRSAPSR